MLTNNSPVHHSIVRWPSASSPPPPGSSALRPPMPRPASPLYRATSPHNSARSLKAPLGTPVVTRLTAGSDRHHPRRSRPAAKQLVTTSGALDDLTHLTGRRPVTRLGRRRVRQASAASGLLQFLQRPRRLPPHRPLPCRQRCAHQAGCLVSGAGYRRVRLRCRRVEASAVWGVCPLDWGVGCRRLDQRARRPHRGRHLRLPRSREGCQRFRRRRRSHPGRRHPRLRRPHRRPRQQLRLWQHRRRLGALRTYHQSQRLPMWLRHSLYRVSLVLPQVLLLRLWGLPVCYLQDRWGHHLLRFRPRPHQLLVPRRPRWLLLQPRWRPRQLWQHR